LFARIAIQKGGIIRVNEFNPTIKNDRRAYRWVIANDKRLNTIMLETDVSSSTVLWTRPGNTVDARGEEAEGNITLMRRNSDEM